MHDTIANNTYIAHEELFPYHGVVDAAKFDSLAADMRVNGWVGAPLVKFDSLLLTGSHRYEAAKEAGIAIPVVDLLDIFCIDDEVAELIEEGSGCLEVELTRLAIADDPAIAAELGMDIY
jgi:ParB-like chromosome segregation protein Spo0J